MTAHHYSNSQNSIISFNYSWFLAKNLSNFVSLPWKLHNKYCHTKYYLCKNHTKDKGKYFLLLVVHILYISVYNQQSLLMILLFFSEMFSLFSVVTFPNKYGWDKVKIRKLAPNNFCFSPLANVPPNQTPLCMARALLHRNVQVKVALQMEIVLQDLESVVRSRKYK